MTHHTTLPFSFPAVHAKKFTIAFDGGRLTSNAGVMLLSIADRRLDLTASLARIPKARELATPEFATLKSSPVENRCPRRRDATRIRLAFAAACPEADLIR